MEEKAKSKVLIYIIVVLVVLILVLVIWGIVGYRNLLDKIDNSQETNQEVSNNSNNIGNVIQDEKQIDETVKISGNVATKNIMLNGEVAEIKLTIASNVSEQSTNDTTYISSVTMKIDESEVENSIEDVQTVLERNDTLNISDMVQDVTTIKSEDNKDYVVLKLQAINYYTSSREYYYIVSEDGEVLKQFTNDHTAGIILSDYSGDYLQVKDDCVIEYEAIAPTEQSRGILKKWKYTIKNGELVKNLETTYTEDQFQQEGKSW